MYVMNWWSEDRSIKVLFKSCNGDRILKICEDRIPFSYSRRNKRSRVSYARMDKRSFVSFEEATLIIVGRLLV